MDKEKIKKYKAILKWNHTHYLAGLTDAQKKTANLEDRFKNLRSKYNAQLRKQGQSTSSIKKIPTVSRILFGLQEDIFRLSLPKYDFKIEREVLNLYVIKFLENRRDTQYGGECEYYGEIILNLYLDIFITLTCFNTPRSIEHKPGFLINPKTGSNLELDILLEEFLLAFEFQGESHYREEKEREKDKLKLELCADNRLVLIPVNTFQLSAVNLMNLVCNSMKDAIGLDGEGKTFVLQVEDVQLNIHRKNIRAYKKACQRIYLASTLFQEALEWVDGYAKRFRDTQQRRSPISASTEAPRLVSKAKDMSVKMLYSNLKYVRASNH